MKSDLEIVQQIITRLLDGQEILSPEVVALMRQDDYTEMSLVLMYEVTRLFTKNSEKVDWKSFMHTVEALLWETSPDFQKTAVQQGILETFTMLINSGAWSSEWILPHVGTMSRKAIQESDAFQKTKTPGF